METATNNKQEIKEGQGIVKKTMRTKNKSDILVKDNMMFYLTKVSLTYRSNKRTIARCSDNNIC